ncbi:MAG: nitroreductase family protein [Pacificimonas sp.]|jgi:hypothetical protein|nr:nitroreductase family protein [Pacificimonas sp.]
MNRRQILKGGGAAALVFVAGGSAWLMTRSTADARAPWQAANDDYDDPRIAALHYAILAPNPHNRQPWLVELVGEDRLRVHADPDRMLPHTDPPNRQITIGFGAFLEMLRMAAATNGFRAVVTPFPGGANEARLDGRPIADVRFVRGGAAADPLFAHALERRTNKEAYDTARPAPDADLAAIADTMEAGQGLSLRWTSAPAEVAELARIAKAGFQVETKLPRTMEESIKLMRFGAGEINANPDGIDIGGAMMEVGHLAGVVTADALRDPASMATAESDRMYNSMIDSAPTWGWLVSRSNTRFDQLNTGAAWLRMQLAATEAGINMHPMSQVLQEFPEMAPLYREFHETVGVEAPSRVQGLFRFGYGPDVAASPRWPLETRMMRV